MQIRSSSTMRRVLAGVAAAALAVPLAACTTGQATQTPSASGTGTTTITFSAWDDIPQAWFDSFTAQNPNIKVDFTRIPGDSYNQKINQMVVGGQAPDVMLLQEADLGRFASSGVIENLDSYMANSTVKATDFIPAVSELAKTTGGNYGLPWCVASELLYYNKDMFDAAGVSYPTKDWTWDDFAAAAQKLTETSGSKTTQWGADALTFNGIWYSLAGQAGDPVVADGKLALGDGLRKALAFQNKLTNESKVSPPPSSGDTVADLFAAGKAAMTRNGSWMIGAAYKDAKFNWDIAPLPAETQSYTSLHTGFYTINAKSANKDAAWKFIEYMMSEEGQKATSTWSGNMSAVTSIAAKGYNKIEGKNGPSNWDAITESLDQGKFGYTTVNSTPTTNLTNQFNGFLLGTTTTDDIINTDVPKANNGLEELK